MKFLGKYCDSVNSKTTRGKTFNEPSIYYISYITRTVFNLSVITSDKVCIRDTRRSDFVILTEMRGKRETLLYYVQLLLPPLLLLLLQTGNKQFFTEQMQKLHKLRILLIKI